MNATSTVVRNFDALGETELLDLARRGERDAFRQIMQRCNQRLFRCARSIVGDDAEAEDVVQESYVRAFAGLENFRGDASLPTWLTRIVVNEARGRLRQRKATVALETLDIESAERVVPFPSRAGYEDPMMAVAHVEIRRMLERAIDDLPEPFRLVFVLREIQELSVEETAEQLELLPETVKTRLFRARRLLRNALSDGLTGTFHEAFLFLGPRCARVTENVLRRLAVADPKT